jgi:hypothetical protein
MAHAKLTRAGDHCLVRATGAVAKGATDGGRFTAEKELVDRLQGQRLAPTPAVEDSPLV